MASGDVTPLPLLMKVGTQIDYWLKVRGVPMRWRSEITAWDPPHRFVDRQLKGPYRRWEHEHLFEETPTGTLVRDRVIYRPRGGLLVNWWVKRDLAAIFEYRQDRLGDLLRAARTRSRVGRPQSFVTT